MKTAISIPDSLYDSIEDYLEKSGLSRSEFFQRAARHYLRRASAEAVIANLNEVHAENEPYGEAAFRRAALAHVAEPLKDDEW